MRSRSTGHCGTWVTSDPYCRHFRRLEGRGTHRWLQGTVLHQEPGLGHSDYLHALGFLRSAHEANRQVDLGWIGVATG